MFSKVFIIEDTASDATQLINFLNVCGIKQEQIITIINLEKAFNTIESIYEDDKYYLAFVDVVWNGIDMGTNLAKTLRKKMTNLKVLAFTSVGEGKRIDDLVDNFHGLIDKVTSVPHPMGIIIAKLDYNYLENIRNASGFFDPNNPDPTDTRSVQESVTHVGNEENGIIDSEESHDNILIISALREELEYLLDSDLFNKRTDISFLKFHMWKTDVFAPTTLIACTIDQMGLTDTAILATTTIRKLKPKYVFFVGICAGRSEAGVELGDVIVPNKVYHYQYGAYEGGEIRREIKSENTDNTLLRMFKEFVSDETVLSEIYASCKDINRPRTFPKVLTEPMASGDIVVKDKAKIEEAVEADRKVAAIDMESYAVVRAAKIYEVNNVLIIKVVTDFADKDKEDSVRSYAKKFSNQLLCHFLEQRILK